MEILVGAVVIVLALIALGCCTGDDNRSYEEYRRAEYRNEYLWESRQKHNDNYLLDAAALRRP